jgi:Putative Actinobacterial Holin-X, holin superfamily III
MCERDSMVRSATPETNHSLGDLVAQATRDISQLVRYEIDLAKSELKKDGKRVLFAALCGALCALAGCLIVILLCFAFAYMLHDWAGAPGGMAGAFALTAAAVAILAIIAVVIARLLLKDLTKMRRTRKTMTDDIAMLRRSNGNGATPGAADGASRGVGAGTSRGVGAGASPAVGAGAAGKLTGADGKPAPLPDPPAG